MLTLTLILILENMKSNLQMAQEKSIRLTLSWRTCMHTQVNDEGNQFQILEEIVDHHKNHNAVPISDGMIQSTNGMEKPKIMT